MEPIKSIEGIRDEAQGPGLARADLARDRYWQQQAQDVRPVESGEEAPKSEAKRQGQREGSPAEASTLPAVRHTYAEFEVNQETQEVTVRIIDAESGKLVHAIPPDELAREIARGNFSPSQLRRRAVLV
jgi:uncharacterized FlaG/YvyC family protein